MNGRGNETNVEAVLIYYTFEPLIKHEDYN